VVLLFSYYLITCRIETFGIGMLLVKFAIEPDLLLNPSMEFNSDFTLRNSAYSAVKRF